VPSPVLAWEPRSMAPDEPNSPQAPAGDLDKLFARLYDDLRNIARGYMAGERADHTLQPTALVHEAYVRLISSGANITDRPHFLRLAARTMRRILIDEARKRKADKAGGQHTHISLHDDAGVVFPKVDMIDFD